jgi:hypothetical protein
MATHARTNTSRRLGVSVAGVAILGLLAGCQSPTAGSSAPTRSVPAAPVASTTSSAATSSDETKIVAGADYQPFGHFLYKRPFNSPEDPSVDGPIELFVIGHGPVTLRAAALFPDKEVTSESYTSIGTAAQPLIAAAVQTREEAKGLDPQQYVTVLAAVDPASQKVLHTTEVLRGVDASDSVAHKLTGSPNGSAAAFSTDTTSSAPANTVAFDAMNGTKLWEKQGWIQGPVLGAVTVLTTGTGVGDDGETPCEAAVDIEVGTGKTLHTIDSAAMGSPCPSIEVIAVDSRAGTPQQAEKQKFVRITASTSDKESTYDALTGTERTLPETLDVADPHSDLVFPLSRVSDRNSQRVEPFGVLDTTTGKPVWTLDAQQAYQLEATVRAIYKRKLYLETTDQAPVIDLDTGKTISDNDPRYPIGAVDSWTYWSDGTLEKDS